ncbi:hypothetical protein AAEO56_11720 [Flavobacterium sp. DGU11]|uniref:DUF4840 domain-containing protein n=1 Tax=Flavobacterium arundinis TaxID=3139143 RepID=A0ABU9HXS0_9FLAO
MKEVNSAIIMIIVLALFISCKDDTAIDDSKIRTRYFNLEKYGWKTREHTQKVDRISFKAAEVPVAYYILNNKGNDNLFEIDSIEKANNSERIIEFNFSDDEEKDLLNQEFTGMEYDDAVKYMSFSINKDFYVVTSKKDTIPCSGIVFERSFKVAPIHKLLLFFGNIKPKDKIQLIYNDQLFGKGILKFKFEQPIIRAEL